MRLSRFLPEIGCQAAHMLPGWEMMLPQNNPARFAQQSFTRLPDFLPQAEHAPWNNTETTNQRSVPVKLSDEILCLSCQLEQPACPMILCSFVCGWSSCPSPLCFQNDVSSASLRFHCAEPLFRSLVQVGFGALAPQHPETLHVSLLAAFPRTKQYFALFATTRFAVSSSASGSGSLKFKSSSCAQSLQQFAHTLQTGRLRQQGDVWVCQSRPPGQHHRTRAC